MCSRKRITVAGAMLTVTAVVGLLAAGNAGGVEGRAPTDECMPQSNADSALFDNSIELSQARRSDFWAPPQGSVPSTGGGNCGAAAPRIDDYSNSGCLGRPGEGDWPCPDEDQIELTVDGHSLHVLHANATYNCCPDDIVISLSLEGSIIKLTEEEILTVPCDCVCCYDVAATVVDLPSGEYLVVFCWFDYETWRVECFLKHVVIPSGFCRGPGDPRGSANGTPAEPGSVAPGDLPDSAGAHDLVDTPFVGDHSNTGCKRSAGDPWPCENDDQVFFTVEEGRLHVLHVDVTYNCCPDDIVFWLSVEGNELHLTEEEILTNPCYCICCYDAQATVYDLQPGEYLVELCWYDYEEDGQRCHEELITIP